ncbi:MAG: NIPSNAP family protein [Bacteroidota bacterium]
MKHILAPLLFILLLSACTTREPREIYSLTTYRLDTITQEQLVDEYLSKALLPALHRAGVKAVGVFKPASVDTIAFGKEIWVLIPHPSLEAFHQMNTTLLNDTAHLAKGRAYLEATHEQTPYRRMEVTLLEAFTGMTAMETPTLTGPRQDRIYELRSYEGPTEKRNRSKIKMFNAGDEIGLFRTLGFNSVFFGEVLAGSRMPNLMYMTTFDNMVSRDEHWKQFFGHPHWKELLEIEEYKHTVSKADIHLLTPTEYSDY